MLAANHGDVSPKEHRRSQCGVHAQPHGSGHCARSTLSRLPRRCCSCLFQHAWHRSTSLPCTVFGYRAPIFPPLRVPVPRCSPATPPAASARRHRRTQSVDFDKDSAELILPALLEKMAAVEEGQEAAEGTSPDGVARWGPEEAPWLSVEVSWASEQPVTSAARGARGDKSPGRVPVTGTLLGGVKEVIWRGGHLPHLSPLDRPLANAPLEDSPPGGGGDFAVEKCGGPGAPGVASHVLQARHAPPAGRRFKHLRENPMLDNSFSSSVPLVKNAVHVPLSRAADAPLPAESASRAPLASSHSRLDAHAAVPLRVAAASKRAGGEDADGHAGQPGASRHPPAAERGPIAGPVSIRDSFATEDHRHSGPARPPAAEPSLKGLGGWGSEDMVLEESFQSSAGNAGAESSGLFHGGRAKGRRGLKATPGAAQAERGRVQGLVPGIYFFPPGGERTAGRRRAQVSVQCDDTTGSPIVLLACLSRPLRRALAPLYSCAMLPAPFARRSRRWGG